LRSGRSGRKLSFFGIPNAKAKTVVMYVIKINGIKTMNHEIMPKPALHNKFSASVNTIITINFKNAVVVSPLNISIIIWVMEKAKYNIAGGQIYSTIMV
jgi:hypothetical protein